MRLNAPVLEDRTHFLLLASLSFLILFVPLRRGDLSGYDDAVYAHQAKEILRTGDWWNLRYNGAPSFGLPPMFLWMEALSLSVFGLSDLAAKIPAAVAGFGTIVLVYYLARELTDDLWVSRLAMLVLVSTQFFMRYATHAMTDVPFTFFCTLAIFLYVKGLRSPGYLVLAGLPVACAILTRSVLGIIPAGIVVAHLVATRRYDVIRSRQFAGFVGAGGFPAGHFGSCVQYRLHGIEFVRGHAAFVLAHGVRRTSPGRCGMNWGNSWNTRSSWRRDIGPGCRSWPWDYTSRPGMAISRRDSGAVLLVVWVLGVIVPLSFAEIKYLRYILAAFPAFAILSAQVLNDWIPLRRKIQSFTALYALGGVFVIYAALVPMTLLRATDMRLLAPVVDVHTSPQERILVYTAGRQDWGIQNQLLWYGNRNTELLTDLADVKSKLESGTSTVVVIDKEAAGRLMAELAETKTERLTVLAQSDNFYCLKYSAISA